MLVLEKDMTTCSVCINFLILNTCKTIVLIEFFSSLVKDFQKLEVDVKFRYLF